MILTNWEHLFTLFEKKFVYIGCQILNKNLFNGYNVESFPVSKIWDELLIKDQLLFRFQGMYLDQNWTKSNLGPKLDQVLTMCRPRVDQV